MVFARSTQLGVAIGLCAFLFQSQLLAQPVLHPEPKSFVEHFEPSVPIGLENAVAGFGAISLWNADRWILNELPVNLPPSQDKTVVCLDIHSQDGKYRASARYRLPASDARMIRLNVPTSHRAQLSRYSNEEMAFRVRLSSSCDTAPSVLVAAGVAQTSHALYINSRGGMVRLYYPDTNSWSRCQPVGRAGARIEYDSRCEVSEHVRGSEQTVVVVRNRHEKRIGPDLNVRIYLP